MYLHSGKPAPTNKIYPKHIEQAICDFTHIPICVAVSDPGFESQQDKTMRKKMPETRFMNAKTVADFMGVSLPTAYKIIRQLNMELKAQGYIVISGKVPTKYFEKKFYGSN